MADGRVLLTQDKDFGELVVRLGLPARGVVILLLGALPSSERAGRAVAALTAVGDAAAGHLTVVTPDRSRRRPIGTPNERWLGAT